MLKLSKEGKAEEANALNESLMPLHKRLFVEANPIPVKKALNIMGKIGPGIRPPLAPLDQAHIASIQEALIVGGCIN